jgi:hypothetical protein
VGLAEKGPEPLPGFFRERGLPYYFSRELLS